MIWTHTMTVEICWEDYCSKNREYFGGGSILEVHSTLDKILSPRERRELVEAEIIDG